MRRFAFGLVCILQTILFAHADGNKYSVIGPGTIHSKSQYNVAVAVYQTNGPSQIKVGITGPSFNDTKIVDLSANEVKNVVFDVPVLEKGDYNLTAEGVSGFEFTNTTKLNYESFFPYVKIQTDKGTYKPGDVVNFRVIFLDENLKPAEAQKDTIIWIEDGKRNRIKSYKNIDIVKGVYTGKFQISEFPVFGYWGIAVFNGNDYANQANFEVEKYVLPKFNVKVESTQNVAVQDGDLHIVVRSNYTYDKPFNGKVTVILNINNFSYGKDDKKPIPQIIKTADVVNGKAKFDLNIKSYEEYLTNKRSSYYMSITATVEENFTGVKINGTASTTVYPYRYFIRCTSYESCHQFKPNEESEVQFKITRVDNTEVKDTKSEVKLTYVEDVSRSYMRYNDETTITPPLPPKIQKKPIEFISHMNESGVATFKVSLPELKEFKYYYHYYNIKVEYAGEEHDLYRVHQKREPKEIPTKIEEPKDYFKISVNHAPNKYSFTLNTDVVVTLNSSEPINYFVYDIIGRGNILHSERVVVSEAPKVYNFTVHTTFLMAPSFSIYAHYVDEKGEYHFAETSSSVDVELQNKIEISTPDKVKPGEDVPLRIKTAPNSFVGLLAVDQSVLLLKENNDLRADDFNWQLGGYNTYTPYQGGYSYCPGQLSGVVTLTNADYFYNWTSPYQNHIGSMNKVALSGVRGPEGAMFDSEMVQQSAGPVGGAAGAPNQIRVRKNFDETWIFANIENTETEEFTWTKKIPDTITSWMLSGFSLNPEKGLGVTKERNKVITFQPFFVSVRLPYSVKRGEVINVPALVFNYLDKALDVTVTLDNTDGEYEFTDVSNEVINEDKRSKVVNVPAQSSAGVSFLLRPKVIGNILLKITAVSPIAGDAIHKALKVVPEGVTEYANRAYFVNLKDKPEYKETFELLLPEEVVPDSEHVEFTVVGDLLGPLLNNLDRLVRMPTGCAEQTISSMIPSYLVFRYLNSTNKITPSLEWEIKRNLEIGYQRILRYRNDDGSFSAFVPWQWARSESKKGSTWLTAYVMQALLEAREFITIDPKIFEKGFEFLATRQADNGTFVESGDIFYASQARHVSLTASVLLAYITNKDNSNTYETNINNAFKYILENLEKSDNLRSKAFATYVLHIGKHEAAPQHLKYLQTLVKTEGDRMWWSEVEKPSHLWWRWAYSSDVEITSYILLVLLDQPEATVDTVLPIIKWLVGQRNNYGGFSSTSDTVVGLKALTKFAQKFEYEAAIMDIDYQSKGAVTKQDTVKVNEENGLLMQINELPPQTSAVDFHAKGKGAALIQVSYQYNILEKEKKPSFTINTVINKDTPKLKLEFDVCVEYVDEGVSSNMAVAEISLPSGYIADEDSFEDIEKVDRVRLVETKNEDTVIVVYFESLLKGEVKCLPISAFRSFSVALQKPNPVVVYDYYDTAKKATTYYEVVSKLCEVCDTDEECQKACQ